MDKIEVRGARTHNLKNINVTIPRDKLTVITGLSGSGKSSLAFDTLYAEGQRRYVESLSAYARQFLSMMEKPDVDHIEGLSPAISIEQKSTSHNPRSTVGTITEIYDYLRLLYARVGEPRCPDHHVPLNAQTISQMVDRVCEMPEDVKLMLLAPVVQDRKGEHVKTLENLSAQGFIRARIDGEVCDLSDPPPLDLHKKHTIEVVVDRFKVREDLQLRLAESFETALKLADGIALVAPMDDEPGEEMIFSARFACPICGHAISELEPKLFSFNNPAGACPTCDGLGVKQFFDIKRLVNGELTLAYQPKFDFRAGRITGIEALMRWTHSRRGRVSPDLFIGMAEETGHIRPLTEWAIRRAIADQKTLTIAGHDLTVSVNISGRLLSDESFADFALAEVAAAGADLCFEITETAVVEYPDRALRIVERFAGAGISVSLDDYGSGLSSLTYLKQICADELKIDKSFILGLDQSARDALLVKSTIDLAHGLGMKVTAEGVETPTALALLRAMGCDQAQGYLIGRAVPLVRLIEQLAAPDVDLARQA